MLKSSVKRKNIANRDWKIEGFSILNYIDPSRYESTVYCMWGDGKTRSPEDMHYLLVYVSGYFTYLTYICAKHDFRYYCTRSLLVNSVCLWKKQKHCLLDMQFNPLCFQHIFTFISLNKNKNKAQCNLSQKLMDAYFVFYVFTERK